MFFFDMDIQKNRTILLICEASRSEVSSLIFAKEVLDVVLHNNFREILDFWSVDGKEEFGTGFYGAHCSTRV